MSLAWNIAIIKSANTDLNFKDELQSRRDDSTSITEKCIQTELTGVKHFNDSAAIEIIDMTNEPDGAYNYILCYRDGDTKICVMKPLRSKQVAEISRNLFEIFSIMPRPRYLSSSTLHPEFVKLIAIDLEKNWQGCNIKVTRNAVKGDSIKLVFNGETLDDKQ